MYASDKSTPDANVMDAYRRQMMEMYRQVAPPPPFEKVEDNWLDQRYPEPNIEQDKATMVTQTTPAPQPRSPIEPAPALPDYVGYLRTYVFTGGGAEPVVGARVIVTRPDDDEPMVYANLITDGDGFTPVIALPSVDPALTLQPGNTHPYVAYTIRTTADGFQPVEHQNVPVYGNNYLTQPVAMTPILPGPNAENTQEFISGGPANL